MAGLYLHIPFCKQACHYCDFHFSTDQRYRFELCQAIATELALQKEYLGGAELQSVYLGGGTPSLLSAKELDILFSAIHRHFSVSSSAEITLEANPDDLTPEKIQDYASISINRLSIGIQSFNNTLLTFLNRAHDGHSAVKCLHDVEASPIQNYSLDLIYGIPGLSKELWKETLEQALSFKPPHISSYALTIEEKTVFGHWQKKGKFKTEEEEAARHFEILMDTLEVAGYEHYEISNFCKPGFYARHNSSYWKQAHYLGIGPGAHSYNGITRHHTIRNNALYTRSIKKDGVVPFEREVLSVEDNVNEYIMTTLRTQWGCDLNYLKEKLGDDLRQRCHNLLTNWQQQDLITLNGQVMRLTRKGKLLADGLTEGLMVTK